VYNSFQLAKKYLHYYRTALNGKGHGMHSPFVFQFILHVLNNKSGYEAKGSIETLRQILMKDNTLLQIEDLGAGSRKNTSTQRTICSLAKSAVKPRKYGEVLFRLAKYYGSENIIELGTSLGITSAYLATSHPRARLKTIEGSIAIHNKAVENFHHLGLENVEAIQGNFDIELPLVLQKLRKVDIGYIDGNHRYEPTIRYFRQLLEHSHNDTILVFDDIHWSREMEEAWAEIKQHPAVRCTVDIFFLGFVFLRHEFKIPQHFIIRF
jgi:predicted O-methyltransferase YrrM